MTSTTDRERFLVVLRADPTTADRYAIAEVLIRDLEAVTPIAPRYDNNEKIHYLDWFIPYGDRHLKLLRLGSNGIVTLCIRREDEGMADLSSRHQKRRATLAGEIDVILGTSVPAANGSRGSELDMRLWTAAETRSRFVDAIRRFVRDLADEPLVEGL